MTTAAIIVAAGRGTRAGGTVAKQYQLLLGRPVLRHTVERFARHRAIDQIIVVTHPDDQELCETALVGLSDNVSVAEGGATRAQSVKNGLKAASATVDKILIHDAARPLVSDALIGTVIRALDVHQGAAPAIPVVDALWRAQSGSVSETVDRSALYRAQTPQGFHLSAIRAAHEAVLRDAADDVEVARSFGIDVKIVEGDENNIKITHPNDFARVEAIMKQEQALDIRCGNGFDVHSFVDGDHVILCGVKIPFEKGLNGHSDSDVGMHALTDAIYGALGLGDIGAHFPPSDDTWKGADSRIFLRHAVDQARGLGFALSNCDVTLICERPKIGPYVDEMKAALADAMEVEASRVSVKATTSEKLGFTGRGEGIAAIASATLVKP